MKKRTAFLLAASLTASLFASTSVSAAADEAKDGEKFKIGCVIISGTIQHCQLFQDGFKDTCDKYGAESVVLDADYDPAVLMSSLSDLISMGCDGIVVEACDATAPLQGIKEAAEAGIVVAASDMPLDFDEDDGYVISQTVSDNYAGGYACGEDVVAKANGEEFNVCIMELQTNASAVERVKGFQDAIAEHDNIKILDIGTPSPENLEEKMAVCDAWVERFDDIDAIFCYHDPAAIACVSSLSAAGRLENTLLYGVDGNEENLVAIQDGKITGSAKQDPYTMAASSTEDVFTVLNGGEIDHDFLTYIPVTYIDKTNVDEFLN